MYSSYNFDMTIALMFSGLPRVKSQAIKFWQSFILEHSPKVFIHTWSDTEDYLTHFDTISRYFNPQRLRIDQPITFDTTPYESHQYADISISNILSMWTSISRCFHDMEAYYHNREKPKTVIRTRLDVCVPDGLEIVPCDSLVIPMEPLKEPGCHQYKQQFIVSQQEIICYGSYDQIKVYSDCINHIPHIMASDETFPFVSEYIIAAHLWDRRQAFWNQTMKFELVR